MKTIVMFSLLLALGCGSPEAPAAAPTTVAPPTSIAPPAPVAPPAVAWAPAVSPAVTDVTCAIDTTPLTIATGEIAAVAERPGDEEAHGVLRVTRRQGAAIQALRCERLPVGTMEMGDVREVTTGTVNVGGTSLLFIEETGAESTEGEISDYRALWVFDTDMRLLGLIIAGLDDGPVAVDGTTIHVGLENRALSNGEIVSLPSTEPAED